MTWNKSLSLSLSLSIAINGYLLCASSSLPLPFGRNCTSKVAQTGYHPDERELYQRCVWLYQASYIAMCYIWLLLFGRARLTGQWTSAFIPQHYPSSDPVQCVRSDTFKVQCLVTMWRVAQKCSTLLCALWCTGVQCSGQKRKSPVEGCSELLATDCYIEPNSSTKLQSQPTNPPTIWSRWTPT